MPHAIVDCASTTGFGLAGTGQYISNDAVRAVQSMTDCPMVEAIRRILAERAERRKEAHSMGLEEGDAYHAFVMLGIRPDRIISTEVIAAVDRFNQGGK